MSRKTSVKVNRVLLSSLGSICITLIFSCDFVDKQLNEFHREREAIVEELSVPVDSNGVIKTYYDDGSLMDEINYKDGIRHGEMVSYYRNGVMRSKLNYLNGQKHGKSYQYYKDGKLNMEIDYENGKRNGFGKWYFTSGELYELTPYVNGEIDGLKKRFYKNGSDKHIIPYKQGMVGTGLKEYNKKGELVTDYPKIVVKTYDKRATEEKFIIELSLDKPAKGVEFFIGKLEEGEYFNERNTRYVEVVDDKGIITAKLPPHVTMKETLNIIATAKTKRKNPLVLAKVYTVEIGK